jgi:hypothetical protein
MKNLLTKITASDYFLLALFIILGILNYGWVLWPTIGNIWGFINGGIIGGIFIIGLMVSLFKYTKGKAIKNSKEDI